jgi:predicted AAA+ superfamily ATPase
LEAWIPTFAPLKRLTHTPKHHLVDPAIAARLVGIDKESLLRGEARRVSTVNGTWLGALFESLVVQSVRVYADAAFATVGHLRTKNNQHEVDLIVEDRRRSCVAIEVKLANTGVDDDVEHLSWLQKQIGERLVARIVIYTGTFAYQRADGISVVPLALLGPSSLVVAIRCPTAPRWSSCLRGTPRATMQGFPLPFPP